MRSASGHLLRTLAAVSPQSRVVIVGCGDGVHAEAIARLGFDVWACDADARHVTATHARLGAVLGTEDADRRAVLSRLDALGYPDGFADWIVLDAVPEAAHLVAVVAEAARVLAPGAWLWTETPDPEAFLTTTQAAGLMIAEAPASEPGRAGQHVIVRTPGGGA
ncbi:MAG: methyltransferase domain-containing protein [Bacteroidota bacterium]